MNTATGWVKSSFSAINGNCVEVSFPGQDQVLVRDSKDDRPGPVLEFTRQAWEEFLQDLQDSRFRQPLPTTAELYARLVNMSVPIRLVLAVHERPGTYVIYLDPRTPPETLKLAQRDIKNLPGLLKEVPLDGQFLVSMELTFAAPPS